MAVNQEPDSEIVVETKLDKSGERHELSRDR